MDVTKRRQLENNDPELVRVKIGPNDGGGDWGRLGALIGRNTHVRKLVFANIPMDDSDNDLTQLLRGISSNQEICFYRCGLYDGEILFSVLIPLFKSSNFRCLDIEQCVLGHDNIRSLASALSEFDSLKEFRLCKCPTDQDDGARDLIQALYGHYDLEKLSLKSGYEFKSMRMNSFAALATILQRPGSELAVLDVSYIDTDDEAVILATGLTGNSTLQELDLSESHGITEAGWRAILSALQSPSCRLEKLSLGRNLFINDDAALSLAQTLTINMHIMSLDLSSCCSITAVGWRYLFEFLQSPNCVLEVLHLRDNEIINEAVIYLASGLVGNNRLRELDLSDNLCAASIGWEAFSAVLRSPNSALEKLDLRLNTINDETAISLASSLANNSKLQELLLEDSDDDSDDGVSHITASGWAAFSRVLCNTSSIMDTHCSNHTLQRLTDADDDDVRLPEDVRSLLQINQENSKRQAARLKIITTHFPEGFVQPFISMDLNVLPHAIAWMGRYDGAANEVNEHFYGFLRSMPLLFDVEVHKTNHEGD